MAKEHPHLSRLLKIAHSFKDETSVDSRVRLAISLHEYMDDSNLLMCLAMGNLPGKNRIEKRRIKRMINAAQDTLACAYVLLYTAMCEECTKSRSSNVTDVDVGSAVHSFVFARRVRTPADFPTSYHLQSCRRCGEDIFIAGLRRDTVRRLYGM